MRDDQMGSPPTEVIETSRSVLSGRISVAVIAVHGLTVLAGLVALGRPPSDSTWLRVLVVWVLATIALPTIGFAWLAAL